MRGTRVAIALAVASALGAMPAAAEPCGARGAAIRAHLDREAHRAGRWDKVWGIGFGVAAAGQAGMAIAEFAPGREFTPPVRDNLWSGAIKAGVASLSHVVLPLRVARPGPPGADACADDDAADRALRKTAREERTLFWLGLVGGLLANGAATVYIGVADDDWGEGLLTSAVGVPIGIAHVWSQPRGSWRAVDRGDYDAPAGASITSLRLDVRRSRGFTGLVLSGEF